MNIRESLLALAQKTSHRIPEIRERSVRALCGKLLSPLASDDHFIVLSESPGFVTSILEWVNERYDTCDYRLLLDVVAACQRMVERNETLRLAFLDAGGVAFFDEFAVHNPAMKSIIEQLISAMLHGSPTAAPNTRLGAPDIEVIKPRAPPPQQDTHPSVVSNDDEQVLFDLAVRIKFATHATPLGSIQEIACAILYSIAPVLPPSTFVEFPVIVEAICGQLRMSNSINPVTSKCCEPLLSVLDKILDRLDAVSESISSAWIANILSSLIDSFGRRPECIHRTAKIAMKLLHITNTDTEWSLPQLETIVRATVSAVTTTFPPEKYFVEKFEFMDCVSPVLLRKLHQPLSSQEFLVVEIAIEVIYCVSNSPYELAGITPKAIDLIQHVSDWICDEGFYQSSRNAKQLASKAAIALPDNAFDRARQILVSLKKFESRGEILTDIDFGNLVMIYMRVPELLGSRNNPVEILSLMINQGEWTMVTEACATDSSLADALIDFAATRTPLGDASGSSPQNWPLQTIAFTKSTRPGLFVEAVAKLAPLQDHDSFGNIFFPTIHNTSVSTESLVRSVFSTNQATRKQSIVTLWHQFPGVATTGECPTDLSFSCGENLTAKYKLKTAIHVEESELTNACKLALNQRLTTDIRIASATQACTLIANSSSTTDWMISCLSIGDFVNALSDIVPTHEDGLLGSICDLFCLLVDSGIVSVPNGSDSILRPLVELVLSCQSAHILRVLSRVVFARPVMAENGTISNNTYWGLIHQLRLIGDYDLMDLGVGKSVQYPNILDRFTLSSCSEKILAICVSLVDSVATTRPAISPNPSEVGDIEGALLAQIPIDESTMKKFILSIEALSDSDDYVSSILVPAIRISQLVESGTTSDTILNTVSRVISSLGTENFSEYEIANLVEIQKHLLLRSSIFSIPSWIPRLLATDSLPVIYSVISLLVLESTLRSQMDPPIVALVEQAVFRFPTRYSLLSWLWILAKSGYIERSSLERISQLLDNDGEIGELAWWLLCQFKDEFSFDDSAVWQKAIDKMTVLDSAAKYIADSIIKSPARAGDIMDLLDSNFDDCFSLEVLVALSKTQKKTELTTLLSRVDFWSTIRGDPGLVLDLVVECTRDNSRLLIYILHTGLIGNVLCELSSVCRSLIELMNRAIELSETPHKLNHFDSIMEWISGVNFLTLISNATKSTDPYIRFIGFETCRVASILVRDNFDGKISWSSQEALERLLSEESLLDSHACTAMTELVRVPTSQVSLSQSTKTLFVDLMRFHDTVPVPDSVEIFSSQGSILFYAQVRLMAAVVCEDMIEEYARWFVSIWQRALVIVETKKTSSVPILSEMLCGLIEVLYRFPNAKPLSQPLSYVLSYATRTDEMNPSLFSLCLSVGEAASPLLRDKPVVGKFLRSLISLHATVHARFVPKSVESISRLGSVVRFASSMIGCKVCGVEVMEILDGWVEATNVIDTKLLTRVVGAIVVAPGQSHLRTSLGSTDKGKLILEKMIGSSPADDIGTSIMDVIQATSFKLSRDTATVCGGA